MTPDLAALRARHVPVLLGAFSTPEKFCRTDKLPWPCDAAQLLTLLDNDDCHRAAQPAAGLRVAVERHHEVMYTVLGTFATVEPGHLHLASSVGFYALRRWVVDGLRAAEDNFRAALRDAP